MIDDIEFTEVKRKLNRDNIKPYKRVDLKVNDMHLSCRKTTNGKWHVIVMHEGKDTHKDRDFTLSQLVEFLQAYQITSRGKTLLGRIK